VLNFLLRNLLINTMLYALGKIIIDLNENRPTRLPAS
jgi:hypothetical protein